MTRRGLVLLGGVACSPASVEPAHKDRTVSSDTASTDTGDTGSWPEPEACEAPAFKLVAEFGHMEIADVPFFDPPVALASCGWGLAAVDLNADGAVDLLPLGHTDPTRALINQDGRLVPSDEIQFDGGSMPAANGVGVGDIDGDGLPDLVILRSKDQPDLVFTNTGGGRFVSAPLPLSSEESQDGAFFDADLDGDLDLYVSRHMDIWDTVTPEIAAGTRRGAVNRLYLNEGGVLDAADTAGVPDAASFQAVPMDVDSDGDLDLYVVNDFGMFIEPNSLLVNDGAGSFTDAMDCGCRLEMFGMGASASDFNNDGQVDLHITDFGSPRTLMGMGDGTFVDASAASGALITPSSERVTSWGTAYVDVDQDGWDDMVTAFGPVLIGLEGDWSDTVDHPSLNDLDDSPEQVNAFFHNQRGYFEDRSSEAGFDLLGASRALVTADFNGDGMPDVAISGVDSALRQVVRIYESEGGCGPGITVAFPERSARDVGARVEWSVGGKHFTRWYQPGTTFSVSGPTLHLGLGGFAATDYVRITPTGGDMVEFLDVPAGTRIDQRSYQ